MKKILLFLIIIPILIGTCIGIYICATKQIQTSEDNSKIEAVFGTASTKYAKITKFDTFGTSLNIEGKIESISKDNFEGIRIVVTDGANYTEYYTANSSFGDDGAIYFDTGNINDGIDLENLENRGILYIG